MYKCKCDSSFFGGSGIGDRACNFPIDKIVLKFSQLYDKLKYTCKISTYLLLLNLYDLLLIAICDRDKLGEVHTEAGDVVPLLRLVL